MTRPQVRGYRAPYKSLDISDVTKIIEEIPTLTKIGGICFIMGKFAGVLAIPAVFIPGLSMVAIFLVASWGGLVFTSIALCSYEHFRDKKVETQKEKIALMNRFLNESPALREQLTKELEKENNAKKYQFEEHYESHKVVNLAPQIKLRRS